MVVYFHAPRIVRLPPLVNSELQMPRHPLDWAKMSDTLIVNEIYLSLQGESTFAGLPCIFVRLTACNLRCSYCDTAYAFTEGGKKSLPDMLAEVRRLDLPFSHHDGGKPSAMMASPCCLKPAGRMTFLKSTPASAASWI